MKDTRHTSIWSPRHWPLWLLLGFVRLLVLLPLPVQLMLGRQLGKLAGLSKKRVHIARVNMSACFPEKSATEIDALVDKHFASLGMGIFELASCWWMSDRRLQGRVKITGMDILREAFAKNKGVILLTAHFTTLEIGGRFMSMSISDIPRHAMYRPNENPVIQKLMFSSRAKRLGNPIGKDDVRKMLRALRKKELVWYAADQNYGGKGRVFAPFFNVPASTNAATSKMAAITGALVLPFSVKRISDNGYYELNIMPALENYPSGDDQKDATRTNKIIEDWVREVPEQYLWIHRRFKTRPEGEGEFY